MGPARQSGNSVTLSYRKEKFFRIKTRNEQRLAEFVADGRLNVLYNSDITEIREDAVSIRYEGQVQEFQNKYIFIFAGGEPPFKLLKNIGVQFGLAS